jgi:hypothetical protein
MDSAALITFFHAFRYVIHFLSHLLCCGTQCPKFQLHAEFEVHTFSSKFNRAYRKMAEVCRRCAPFYPQLAPCSASIQVLSTASKRSRERSTSSEPPRSSDETSDSTTSDSGEPTRKLVKVRRRAQKRWLKQYEWLQWEKEGVFCQKACREACKKNPFTSCSGCRNFRTSSLIRHGSARDHRSANQESVMRREFASVTQRVLSENEEAVVCAFKAVYWAC